MDKEGGAGSWFPVSSLAIFAILFLVGLAGCDLKSSGPKNPAWEPSRFMRSVEPVPGASKIGSQLCLSCHQTVQGKKVSSFHAECESCHGGGSLHLADPKKRKISFPSARACLNCHQAGRSTHLDWSRSQHANAGLVCAECHNPHQKTPKILRKASMAGFSRIDDKSSLCLSCHTGVLGKINLPSHHPVKEGILTCVNCHNPHENKALRLAGINERCFQCHQDKQGPWVYDHAPVVEDCLNCHDPHGSANARLQKIAQPVLCLTCHSLADQRHAIGGTAGGRLPMGSLRRCTSCHGAIHGTQEDVHLRF